nr:tape measure protein [uncultured Mediterranean phage uvMED]BAR38429.1 tape measure protein [uncultured Mediterranean phage uvMED]
MAQRLNIDIVARDKSKQALNSVQGALSKVKGAVFNLQNAFIGLGAGLVIRNLVNTGKELENLQVRLKFLLKDTNEGAKAFENMTKFASKVPFSLEQIQSGAGILATVTDNAHDLQNMLEITGNVAAVTGLDFRTTAEQIQRSMSAGIGAADLFREKGVRNMLGFQAGAVVSIEATAQAFEKVFGKGGRFGKATDDLANTFTGTLSMIGDKIFNFKRVLLEAGFFETLKDQFKALDKSLQENEETLDKIAITLGTVLATVVEKVGNGIAFMAKHSDKLFLALKAIVALKIAKMFINIARAIVPVVAGLQAIATLSGVGIPLAITSIGASIATFYALGKAIDSVTESINENNEAFRVQKDILTGADANDGFVEPVESALQIIHDFEHELSVVVPSATEKAIQKFRELNQGSLKTLEDKVSNIRMSIAEGINSGITKMSEGLAKAFVMGEKLSETFANMARTFLVKILSTLIEIVARKTVELAIEKLITKEHEKRASMSKSNSLFSFASSFFGGKASGGAVQKGQPYMVGEQGAELFVPNQSGQIQQSARGGNGGSTTVNFNINTVDASGFDELLVRNRGTITALINNAVNERGSKNLI